MAAIESRPGRSRDGTVYSGFTGNVGDRTREASAVVDADEGGGKGGGGSIGFGGRTSLLIGSSLGGAEYLAPPWLSAEADGKGGALAACSLFVLLNGAAGLCAGAIDDLRCGSSGFMTVDPDLFDIVGLGGTGVGGVALVCILDSAACAAL